MKRTVRNIGIKWALPVLAIAMLGLTVIPAEVWRAPANDVTYSGFDPNLVSATSGSGSSVRASTSAIDMTAVSGSDATVTLATTPLQRLSTELDVSVLNDSGPFRIGIWSPWTGTGHFLVFGEAPQDTITFQSIDKGGRGPTLLDGTVVDSTVLGGYQPGSSYRVAISVDRATGLLTCRVSGNDGTQGQASVRASQFPATFSNVQLSLTASVSSSAGTSRVLLRNYSLTLPHQRAWASQVDDPLEKTLLIALALAGALLLAAAIATHRPLAAVSGMVARIRSLRPTGVVAGATALYLLGNVLLFGLGSHPFDMGGEKLWAYVARTYGITQLYYLPNLVSVTSTWHGVPLIESAFPYEPVSAYLSTGIGWLDSLFSLAGGGFGPANVRLEYVIKAVNVIFGLADSALIYLILQQIGVSRRWSFTGAGLFMFNPAVWFSMSVWGQTHVFSLFFVLAAVLLAEKRQPTWAWLALAAACLTRPQMLVFGLLLGIVFLRKFSWSQNVAALSWTVVVTFLILAPLTLATSPSLPIDIMLHNLRVQEGGGNQTSLTTVSQDALSIWPLVTYVAHGASSLQRAFTPSSDVLVDSLTYQRLGQILTVAAMLIVSGALAFRKRASLENGGYLPLVALGIASFLMLLTGTLATHFVLALPFLLLSHRWMGTPAYFYIAAIWTVTTFVPMYGDMGVLISGLNYPLLAPAHNAITNFFVSLYAWDRFITVGVVANICALVWLGFLISRFKAQSTETATA